MEFTQIFIAVVAAFCYLYMHNFVTIFL